MAMTTQNNQDIMRTQTKHDIIVPRLCVTIEVYDNDTKQMIVNDAASVSRKEGAIAMLKAAIHNLESKNL